jgi:hypothetical protein
MFNNLPEFYFSVVIGLMLSDGWLGKDKKGGDNVRLELHQSLSNFEYL